MKKYFLLLVLFLGCSEKGGYEDVTNNFEPLPDELKDCKIFVLYEHGILGGKHIWVIAPKKLEQPQVLE